MGEKGCISTAGGDIWSMGFDVDLHLDAKKAVLNNTIGSEATAHSQSHHNDSLSYGDMLLQRFDVLNDGDITDLTNSLPKGDTENTAQSLIGKIASQDLTIGLSSQGPGIKNGDPCILTQVNPIHTKLPLQPVDVYGRVTLFEGKLVLQLRHFNVNTNYPLSVDECWLCREKINNGSSIHSHKHVLQGLFQVNDEFIQMDIDHYIIPDQALDPSPSNGASTKDLDSFVSHSASHIPLVQDSLHSSPTAPHSSKITMVHDSLQKPIANSTSVLHNSIIYSEQEQNHLLLDSSLNSISKSSHINIVEGHNNCHNSELVYSESISNTMAPDRGCGNASLLNSNLVSNKLFNENELKQTEIKSFTDSSNPNFNNHGTDLLEKHISTTSYDSNISQKGNFFFDHYYNNYSFYNNQNVGSQPQEKVSTNGSPVTSLSEPVYLTLNTKSQESALQYSKSTEIGAKKRKSTTQKKPRTLTMKPYIPSSEAHSPLATLVLPEKTKRESNSTKQDGSQANSKMIEPNLIKRKESKIINVTKKQKPDYSKINSSKNGEIKIGKRNSKINNVNNFKIKKSSSRSKARIDKLRKISSRDLFVSCQICRLNFKNDLNAYKDHLLAHKLSPSFVFLCSCCSKSVSNIDKFILHLKSHPSNRFSCKLCNTTFTKIDKLEFHFDDVHNNYRPYNCDKCSKSFVRFDMLKSHKKTHLQKQFCCDVCRKLFSTSYNLGVHKKGHLNSNTFACNLCDKNFPRLCNLELHRLSVHEQQKFKCDACGKLFSRLDVLNRHCRNIHDEVSEYFSCLSCNKKFRRKDELRRHEREHNKQFKCPQCPSVFGRNEVLQRHLKAHKEKEQCEFCFKFVSSSALLKKHLLLHEKHSKVRTDRDYLTRRKCDLCAKRFKSESGVQQHLSRDHFNASKHLSRDHFNASKHLSRDHFNASKTVKVPRKVVEKKFKCEFCSKSFSRSCNFKVHLKIHNSEPDKHSDDETMLDALPAVLKRKKKYMVPSFSNSNSRNKTISVLNENSDLSLCNRDQISSSNFLLPLDDGAQFIQPQPSSYSETTCTSPTSPINLSTEALTAAAYLLAHPFYEGSYP